MGKTVARNDRLGRLAEARNNRLTQRLRRKVTKKTTITSSRIQKMKKMTSFPHLRSLHPLGGVVEQKVPPPRQWQPRHRKGNSEINNRIRNPPKTRKCQIQKTTTIMILK